MYTNRVQAPVEKIGLTGFDKPLEEFKKLSKDHIAEEKAKAAQLASESNRQKEEQAAKLERSRKDAEAERKRQEKANEEQREKYLSMSEKVDAPDHANMYDGHWAMLEEFAGHLANPETIKRYASSVEGEMEFNALIDQLLTLTDTFETYYKETYGDANDPDDMPTFSGSSNRDLHGVTSIGDINYNTPHSEMMSRLVQLDSKQHTGMRIEGGRVVFTGPDGEEILPGANLDMDVFKPDISERAPMSGSDFMNSGFDESAFKTEQNVRDFVSDGLQDETIQRDAARTYVEAMEESNPNFRFTPEQVLANPTLRMAAFDRFEQGAVDQWTENISLPSEEEIDATIDEEAPEQNEMGILEEDIKIDEEDEFGVDPGSPTGTAKWKFSEEVPPIMISGSPFKMGEMTFNPDDLTLNIGMVYADVKEGQRTPEMTLSIPTTPEGKLEDSPRLQEIITTFDEKYGTGQFEKLWTELKDREIGKWWDSVSASQTAE